MNMLEIVQTAGSLLLELLQALENNHFAALCLVSLAAITAIAAVVWRRPAKG